MSRITRRSVGFCAAAFAVLLITAIAAAAQTSSEEVQGPQLLQSVQQGEKTCSQLTDSEFGLIGEAWIRQVLGSTHAHDAMNNLMSSMMGSSGEQQMHQFMGRRASGCGGGTMPAGFAAMMARMGLMGAYQGAGTGGTGMMGGQGGNGYGYGGMMGGSPGNQSGNNDDNGISAGAMVGMMAVPILAIALALLIFKPWRRSGTARESLDRRFASGELSAEEYRERKKLLEGGGTR